MNLPQVAERLAGQLPALAEAVVDLVWERVPGYGPPRMRSDDYLEAVTPNLDSVIASLGGSATADPRTEVRVRHLGVSRALQGVPLDAIVLSYRCAERVLTDAFVGAATELDGDQLREGLRRLADGFDKLSAITIESYRETQAEVTAHYDRLAGDLVTGLVRGDLRTEQITEAAAVLGWDADLRAHAVALSVGRSSDVVEVVGLQREVLAILGRGRPGRILAGSVGGWDVLVVPGAIDDADVTALSAVLTGHVDADARVTLGEVASSLVTSGVSCRQALAAMHVATSAAGGAGVLRYGDVLLDVLANADRDAGTALIQEYLAPLRGRPQLAETLQAFAAADLSIRRTAEVLIVHPNTVVYRLDRIRELTGHDPRSALELFAFVLAARVDRPDATPDLASPPTSAPSEV